MRDIIFRGKRVDNGEWVEGYYVCDTTEKNTYHYIFPENTCEGIAVIHETIGQYAGLKDKNGKKIFEGDIVKAPYVDPIFQTTWDTDNEPTEIALVKFNKGQYYIEYIEGEYKFTVYSCKERIKIIGNIHDNQELLKVNH